MISLDNVAVTRHTHRGTRFSFRPAIAFTLVELLVVLFIFMLLTAVALPAVKNLLADQKVSQSARSIVGYMNAARSRAIADGRYVGVRIERISSLSTLAGFNEVASIRMRQLVGVPPYTGDAADSKVNLLSISSGIASLAFDKKDNQLLTLNGTGNSPFNDRDLIEFEGGKQFHIDFGGSTATEVNATVDLNSPLDGTVGGTGTVAFPFGHLTPAPRRLSYRIHRSPVVSSAAPLNLVRGVVVDLNYSGIGVSGFQFAPEIGDINQPIDILFGPDGRVEFMTVDNIGTKGPPSGMIFLCLGDSDGVREAATPASESAFFTTERKSVANIANTDSVWIVINPNTGRVVAAPFASIDDAATRLTALPFARSLALLSDTLDAAP